MLALPGRENLKGYFNSYIDFIHNLTYKQTSFSLYSCVYLIFDPLLHIVFLLLSLLSRLSGYEEMKCTVRDVFPAPRVTWTTEPPTFESLRPVTRMLADKAGLYTVDSRLKTLEGRPDLIYICKVTTSYGSQAWTASLREREIKGTHGRDLSIPCSAPTYLSSPSLRWSFSNGEDSSHILSYDSRSGDSVSTPPWDSQVELDGFRVPFGDGSLRLMDPRRSDHTGTYTCVFSVPYSTHTERNSTGGPSHWWILGLVIALMVLALAGMLAYMKLKGKEGPLKTNTDKRKTA
uniref:Ig-like domain-containing protein n=1 Tax=Salarias fasciatus TaxID=181472 RepID=A0A672GIM7_SALFA